MVPISSVFDRRPLASARPRRAVDGLALAALVAFAVGTALRFTVGFGEPLWLDETFTGAIAGQPDFVSLGHQVYADVNAPLYYLVMYGWTRLGGLSDLSLRWPSAVFATAAVLFAFRGGRGLDRRLCLIWGALLGLWQPGLVQASDARCYALLLLMATVTTVAFSRVLTTPDRPSAILWASVGALTILTHYFAVPLIAAQGAILLLRYRIRALRLWPSLVVFAPALGWIAFHAPRLAEFARPEVVWYAPLDVTDLPDIVLYAVPLAGLVCLVIGAGLLAYGRLRRPPDADIGGEVLYVVLASVVGFVLVLAAALLRPSFTLRYTIPFVPGLLLGLALTIRRASRIWPRFPPVAIALFLAALIAFVPPRRAYSFEKASDAIAAAGARRVVFLWDHPSAPVQDPAQLRAVGGFFLARSGHPVEVVALRTPWTEDPQPAFLAAAGADPKTALLWVYDANLPKTAALAHPPRIESIDSAWRCRNHAAAPFVALVCLRGS
jgi:hypothetical protein